MCKTNIKNQHKADLKFSVLYKYKTNHHIIICGFILSMIKGYLL